MRVLLSAYGSRGAGAIRTDGAAVAATLLPGAVSRERPPVPT